MALSYLLVFSQKNPVTSFYFGVQHRRIDAFELWCWRLFRVPWTARRSNQSILKEIIPGISLEGLMLKLETPVLRPPHAKSWLIGKDSDAGRDWEKGMTEDEVAGWHHWLDGCESEWAPGVGDGQGGLACCDLWGHKESDTTGWLNWTELREDCHYFPLFKCVLPSIQELFNDLLKSFKVFFMWIYFLERKSLYSN